MNLTINWQLYIDGATIFACTLILGIYQYRLRRHVRNDPHATVQGMNARVRAAWVEMIMTGTGRDVMAVQTFRNSTMAATLMASSVSHWRYAAITTPVT